MSIERKQLETAIRALKFYANPKHWQPDDWGVPSVIAPPDYGKPGAKARLALENIEKLAAKAKP